MLLHAGLHDLSLLADLPNTHFAFRPTTNDPLAIACACQTRASVDMRIVDHVHQPTRLRQECADLTVIPPAHDTLAVVHETDCETL